MPPLAAETVDFRRPWAAADVHAQSCEDALRLQRAPRASTLLDLGSLGSARPVPVAEHPDGTGPASSRPFACAVRIVVRGQTEEQAIEQGGAIVREVAASLERGPAPSTSNSARQLREGCEHYVLWRNLGAHTLRVEPAKSNNVLWLSKAWSTKVDPRSAWPPVREMLAEVLPHAGSWIDVLERAREDGGIDIKDDCRLEDRSACCHQDGGNCVTKGMMPLVRLAVNVSSAASHRSLDYLEPVANERCVDGAEREGLRVCSISQHRIWHGAAQMPAAYIGGLTDVCHSSSAGEGPCLKRIVTVFALPEGHPLGALDAIDRLRRVGIDVHAIDERHQRGTCAAAAGGEGVGGGEAGDGEAASGGGGEGEAAAGGATRPPTASEVAACASVLRRLSPSDLDGYGELVSAAIPLFRRRVLREAHGPTGGATAANGRRSAVQPQLKRQAQAVQGKVNAAAAELGKLRERHAKLVTCFAAELAHLKALLATHAAQGTGEGAVSRVPHSSGHESEVSALTEAARSLAALDREGRSAVAAASDGLVRTEDAAAAAAAAATATADGVQEGGAEGRIAGVRASGTHDADGVPADDAEPPHMASAPSPPTHQLGASPSLNVGDGWATFLTRPIGRLRTCFVEKNGTVCEWRRARARGWGECAGVGYALGLGTCWGIGALAARDRVAPPPDRVAHLRGRLRVRSAPADPAPTPLPRPPALAFQLMRAACMDGDVAAAARVRVPVICGNLEAAPAEGHEWCSRPRRPQCILTRVDPVYFPSQRQRRRCARCPARVPRPVGLRIDWLPPLPSPLSLLPHRPLPSPTALRLAPPPPTTACHARCCAQMADGPPHGRLIWVRAAKSKVHPPRCDGMKVGLFATRTPHRPNPIGLSLVRVERVEADAIHFSGIDLVDGTPILDVKPYVPFADGAVGVGPSGPGGSPYSVAPWLAQMPTPDLEVVFTPQAEQQLAALAPSLKLLPSAAQARAALGEILAADPRSVHWRKSRQSVEYGFSIDTLNVVVRFDEGVATVTQVQHLELCDRSHVGGRAA